MTKGDNFVFRPIAENFIPDSIQTSLTNIAVKYHNTKPLEALNFKGSIIGAGNVTRTRDLRITNALLYQLSYSSIFNLLLDYTKSMLHNQEFLLKKENFSFNSQNRKPVVAFCFEIYAYFICLISLPQNLKG